jgi:hypothetical protein
MSGITIFRDNSIADFGSAGATADLSLFSEADNTLAVLVEPYLHSFCLFGRNQIGVDNAANFRIEDAGVGAVANDEGAILNGNYAVMTAGAAAARGVDGTTGRGFANLSTGATDGVWANADEPLITAGMDFTLIAIAKPAALAAAQCVVGSQTNGADTNTGRTNLRTNLFLNTDGTVGFQNKQSGTDRDSTSTTGTVTAGTRALIWVSWDDSAKSLSIGIGVSGTADVTAVWTYPVVLAAGAGITPQAGTQVGRIETVTSRFGGEHNGFVLLNARSADIPNFAAVLAAFDAVFAVVD